MPGMLIYFHVRSNTGYAMSSNERAFLRAAERIFPADRVHLAFTDFSRGGAPTSCTNTLEYRPSDPNHVHMIRDYVRQNDITFALGYDQQPSSAIQALREGGVKRVVSYWGAPISSLNRGPKLWAKRALYRITRGKPDVYVFESNAMARRATHGRGVPVENVRVASPGVDETVYRPRPKNRNVLRSLGIPDGRRVIFYAGHMEHRKGVWLLLQAAEILASQRCDFHFLLFGDKPGQASDLLATIQTGRDFVTFGGYRNDLPEIMPQCDLGAIASTGWDSFPATALEMAASGLPLLVSHLDGLPETIEQGVTGFTFPVGDARTLATLIGNLLDDPAQRERMSTAARQRIIHGFTLEHQTNNLLAACELTSAYVQASEILKRSDAA